MGLISDSSFIGYFKINSIRHFFHFVLSSLVLRGAGILNKPTSLSFLEVLYLGKAKYFKAL